jgi:hypothetical protein
MDNNICVYGKGICPHYKMSAGEDYCPLPGYQNGCDYWAQANLLFNKDYKKDSKQKIVSKGIEKIVNP